MGSLWVLECICCNTNVSLARRNNHIPYISLMYCGNSTIITTYGNVLHLIHKIYVCAKQ